MCVTEANASQRRLAALQRYAVPNMPSEVYFAHLVRFASRALRVPIAAINLITDTHQHTKAHHGPHPTHPLPLTDSFCVHTVREGQLTVAPDTRKDPRFRDLNAVRHDIRFYAGAPLTTPEGLHVGALCIMDTQPRLLTPQEEQLLHDFAELTIHELEAHATHHIPHQLEQHLNETHAHLPHWELPPSATTPSETTNQISALVHHGRPPHFTRTAGRTPPYQPNCGAPPTSEAELRRLAYHDALTGLPNRAFFADLLTQTLHHARATGGLVAVGLLDLNGFKSVNDTYGHAVGDELLALAATRLTGLLRADSTLARLGGDEFALLAPGLDSESHLPALAERLMHAFQEPFRLQGLELQINGSLGLAVFPLDFTDQASALVYADLAMYHAKRENLGWTRHTPGTIRPPSCKGLQAALHQALERDDIEVHYQPIMRAGSHIVVAFEALARWTHPERGPLPPAEFLPVAEQSGLIVPLGEQVLRQACKHAARWRQFAPHLQISVNVSAPQFSHPELLEIIERALNEHALPPEALIVELQESVLTETPHAEATVQRLTSLGVHLCIDHFGTGKWNVSFFKRFPVNVLKIDRSYLEDVEEHPDGLNARLVRSLVQLAHSANITSLIEGIETPGQARFMEDAGCNFLQGWLFTKPLPARDVPAFLIQRLIEAAEASATADVTPLDATPLLKTP